MPIRIDAKNNRLSESTKAHVEQACAKFAQFCDRIVNTEVVIDTNERHKNADAVEIIVTVPNQVIVGKGETSDGNLFRAIDEAAQRVEAQLKRYHDKLVDHR